MNKVRNHVVMMSLVAYEAITPAGKNVQDLTTSLISEKIFSVKATEKEIPGILDPGGLICLIEKQKNLSRLQTISSLSLKLIDAIINKNSDPLVASIKKLKVGIFLASAKGFTDDFIWSDDLSQTDPFTQILENIVKNIPFKTEISLTVSNACSSSLVALSLIDRLIDSDVLDCAFVIGADLVGPFIYNGFNSLRLLTHVEHRPFAANRDGLQLGEAVACALVARKSLFNSACEVSFVRSITSPGSIARPDSLITSYKTLASSASRSLQLSDTDLIVAHGVGTVLGDSIEDEAMSGVFSNMTPVVSSKWSVGLSMGASSLIDLIIASEVLKGRKVFCNPKIPLGNPNLKMNYVTQANKSLIESNSFNQVVVNSLGFGEVTALAVLRRSIE